MGAAGLDIDQGSRGCLDINIDLLGVGAIGANIRVRDMGTDSVYEEGVGRIPPQGGPQDDGTTTLEGAGQRLGLLPAGGCDGGGGFVGGGDLCLPFPGHSSAIY